MYWQVYLHKTSLAAEQLLIRVLKRAKELTSQGVTLKSSEALQFFLNQEITLGNFNSETLNIFARLDDYDIVSAMKEWQFHDDFVLKNLCEMLINRDLLKVKLKNKKIKKETLQSHVQKLIETYNISKSEANYFVFTGEISNQAYQIKNQHINILYKNGKVHDIIEATDQLNLKALSKKVTKYYICYPKEKL